MSCDQESGSGVRISQVRQLSLSIVTALPISTLTHDDTGDIASIIDGAYGAIFTITRAWEANIYLINIEYQNRKCSGIAFHIMDEQFGVFRIPSSFQPDDKQTTEEKPTEVRSSKDLIEMYVDEPMGELSPSSQDILSRFSMTPPKQQPIVPLEPEENPLTFIQSRYYTTLYSLKNPLSYFPKTALARLRILCKEDQGEIAKILKSIFVNIKMLDRRHTGHKGLLSTTDDKTAPAEQENQRVFLQTHPEFSGEKADVDKISQLVLDLKIREAQLQILVIFEILYTLGVNEEEFLESNAAKLDKFRRKREKELSKRSLIRSRKGKKKIIPTFLGMGVGVEIEKPEVTHTKPVDEMYECYTTLNNLIDRMGLWDALTTSRSDNNYGFMAYVLVPYYNKKLPHLVKYLVDNIKGSNMKLVSKPTKRTKKATSEDQPKHESKHKHSKFKKVLLEKQPPTLRNAATFASDSTLSNSNDFLTSLKRSKSNLSSKSLTRRQVDLNVKAAVTVEPEPEQPSFIFGNAKRSKSVKSTDPIVVATPVKSRSFSQIDATPIKKPNIVIKATPQKTKPYYAIPETPNVNFLKPGKRDDRATLVAVTPQKIKSPFIEKTPLQTVNSSPLKEITSSTRKKRPGEPIPLEDSPFYTAGLFKRSESLPDQQLFHSDSE